jgi:hypothetical protein
MKTRTCILFALAVATLAAACGEPAVSNPDALAVKFVPLDGARNVDTSVTPAVYFSAEVEPSSVTADSVFLQSASPWSCSQQDDKEVCVCPDTWQKVTDGTAQVSVDDPNVVEYTLGGGLVAKSCYALIVTIDVRGKTQGPLQAVGLRAEDKQALGLATSIKVGAIEDFWTKE